MTEKKPYDLRREPSLVRFIMDSFRVNVDVALDTAFEPETQGEYDTFVDPDTHATMLKEMRISTHDSLSSALLHLGDSRYVVSANEIGQRAKGLRAVAYLEVECCQCELQQIYRITLPVEWFRDDTTALRYGKYTGCLPSGWSIVFDQGEYRVYCEECIEDAIPNFIEHDGYIESIGEEHPRHDIQRTV